MQLIIAASQEQAIINQDTIAAIVGATVGAALVDPACIVNPLQAGVPGGLLAVNLVSEAARVHYDDTLVPPLIGAADVQAAIDALKGGALAGNPNALGYFNPAGNALTSSADLTAAPVDPFGRPQIRDIRIGGAGAMWRQGAWQADGDATNVTGAGGVFYGPSVNGKIGRAHV